MPKMNLKRGDMVVVIAGKDRTSAKGGKPLTGKVLQVNSKKNTIIVEGVNIVIKHQKPNAQHQQGGLVKKEAPIHASNVMYLHKGKPTRIGHKIETKEVDGKTVRINYRFAKSTGEIID